MYMSGVEEIKAQLDWGRGNLESPQDNLSLEDVEWLIEQAEKAERYEKVLQGIVEYSKYEGNRWYENAKQALKA